MKCIVPCCTNRTTKGFKNISFFRFPVDYTIRSEWLKFCDKPVDYVITSMSRICSFHFDFEKLYFRSARGKVLKQTDALPIFKFVPQVCSMVNDPASISTSFSEVSASIRREPRSGFSMSPDDDFSAVGSDARVCFNEKQNCFTVSILNEKSSLDVDLITGSDGDNYAFGDPDHYLFCSGTGDYVHVDRSAGNCVTTTIPDVHTVGTQSATSYLLDTDRSADHIGDAPGPGICSVEAGFGGPGAEYLFFPGGKTDDCDEGERYCVSTTIPGADTQSATDLLHDRNRSTGHTEDDSGEDEDASFGDAGVEYQFSPDAGEDIDSDESRVNPAESQNATDHLLDANFSAGHFIDTPGPGISSADAGFGGAGVDYLFSPDAGEDVDFNPAELGVNSVESQSATDHLLDADLSAGPSIHAAGPVIWSADAGFGGAGIEYLFSPGAGEDVDFDQGKQYCVSTAILGVESQSTTDHPHEPNLSTGHTDDAPGPEIHSADAGFDDAGIEHLFSPGAGEDVDFDEGEKYCVSTAILDVESQSATDHIYDPNLSTDHTDDVPGPVIHSVNARLVGAGVEYLFSPDAGEDVAFDPAELVLNPVESRNVTDHLHDSNLSTGHTDDAPGPVIYSADAGFCDAGIEYLFSPNAGEDVNLDPAELDIDPAETQSVNDHLMDTDFSTGHTDDAPGPVISSVNAGFDYSSVEYLLSPNDSGAYSDGAEQRFVSSVYILKTVPNFPTDHWKFDFCLPHPTVSQATVLFRK